MSTKVITPEDRANWHLRERFRLSDGTYKRLPDTWLRATWYRSELNHFAHVSTGNETMIAFTENDDKGVLDRQTVVKPGRYLKRYYGDRLTDDQIRDLATSLCAKHDPLVLKVTQDADEIERVYVNGPRSCMSGPANQYNAGIHPCRVYAGPDLAIAYLEPSKGLITARAVVWPARKKRSRIYGDYTRLNELLVAEGYKERDEGMSGARLQRIPCCDGFVVPYVDYAGYAKDNGKYLIIDNSGHNGVVLTNNCGTSMENTYVCEHCDGRIHPDDACTIDGCDGYYCNGCFEEVTFYCDYHGESHHTDVENVEMYGGTYWCLRAFNRAGFTCPINDTNHAREDGVLSPDGNELWSQEAFDEYEEQKDERAA